MARRSAIAWLALGLCALGGYLWTPSKRPAGFPCALAARKCMTAAPA